MQLIALKTEVDISTAAGISVESIFAAGVIKELRIGNLMIRCDSYSVNAYRVQEFEEVERWRRTAILEGFDPQISYFESEYEAKRYNFPSETKVAIEKVKVQMKDGKYSDAIAEKVDDSSDEMPF